MSKNVASPQWPCARHRSARCGFTIVVNPIARAPSANSAQESAIDLDGSAGDVTSAGRDQQRSNAGDILYAADAPHRHLLFELAAHADGILTTGGENLLQPLRLDIAGTDCVDIDVFPRDFER